MIFSVTLTDGAESCTWYCVVRNIHNQDSAPAPSARPNPSDLSLLVSLEPLYFSIEGLKVYLYTFSDLQRRRQRERKIFFKFNSVRVIFVSSWIFSSRVKRASRRVHMTQSWSCLEWIMSWAYYAHDNDKTSKEKISYHFEWPAGDAKIFGFSRSSF